MTWDTKSSSIVYIQCQFGIVANFLDVICIQYTSPLPAKLASVIVPLENCFPPKSVFNRCTKEFVGCTTSTFPQMTFFSLVCFRNFTPSFGGHFPAKVILIAPMSDRQFYFGFLFHFVSERPAQSLPRFGQCSTMRV